MGWTTKRRFLTGEREKPTNLCTLSQWFKCGEIAPPTSTVSLLMNIHDRWRKEFKGAVKLPSRDTVFDYFLLIEGGQEQCKFEPWTKHKAFQAVDFDSSTMCMNEVIDDPDMVQSSEARVGLFPWRSFIR